LKVSREVAKKRREKDGRKKAQEVQNLPIARGTFWVPAARRFQ
jgi:hypothetical protein